MRTSVWAANLPVAQTDRAPLGIVGLENAGAAKSPHAGGELPAEIAGITDARIHAIAARRDVLVRGVADEQRVPAEA
jgi:hypothetical protein